MKKEYRNVQIHLCKRSGLVQKASCSCPAGQSSYCNHIMALLYEVAEYSLNSLSEIPEEKACTSKLRKWGMPGNKESRKQPVMSVTLFSKDQKKGVQPTLYDPRLNFNLLNNLGAVNKLKRRLADIDKNIGYAHIIPEEPVLSEKSRCKFGVQFLGSPLSYQLPPIDFGFAVMTNLTYIGVCYPSFDSYNFENLKLPLNFLTWHFDTNPAKSEEKVNFLGELLVDKEGSHNLEQSTRKQRESLEWKRERKNRVTSTMAHKIFIRKKNFDSLASQLAKPISPHNQVDMVRKALNHGVQNEEVAKEKYIYIMQHQIRRPVKIKEVGLIVQPDLFWLGASPDGVVEDMTQKHPLGLLEIKCPYTHRNSNVEKLVEEKSFYIGKNTDGQYFLKKYHNFGYYTQVQLAMGLSGVSWCHFVVYVYDGIIIVNVEFDEQHFESVVNKVNTFYKDYYLDKLLKSNENEKNQTDFKKL